MQLRKARKRLTITDIDSVGGVDEGDNPGASLLFHKRKTPVTGDVTKGVPMDEQEAVAEVELDIGIEDAVKQVEAEAAAETAAETQVDPAEIAKAEWDERDAVELAKRAADEQIAKAIQERDAAVAALAEEIDKRLDVEWVEKARPFTLLLGSPETMGPALRKIAKACPAEHALLESALHAALGRVELAKILGEVGENTGQTADPISQRDAFVKDMRRLHPDMTVEAARALYWKENPEAVKASREGV